MVVLTEKYRPRRFRDIVGQPRLVPWMKAQIRSGQPGSVLINGPFGTGKTSAGLIYARAILCSRPDEGEPCGTCGSCREFGDRGERSSNVTLFKCGETSTVEEIRELLNIAKHAPFAADRRVFLLDEAHVLSLRASQALLDITERPPSWAVFILMTTNKDNLPPALLSRFTVQELELVKQPEALGFMADICKQEAIEFEVAGLQLIFAAAGGHPRKLLRELEQIRGVGDVTESAVRIALHLDFDERLSGYTSALLAGDLSQQLNLIEDWPETPARKLAVLHQFMTSAYLTGVRRLDRDDPLMRTISDQVRSQLVDGFAGVSDRLRLEPDALWQDALAVLDPREHLTASQLTMILNRLDRLIQKPAGDRDNKDHKANREKLSLSRPNRRLRVRSGFDADSTGDDPPGKRRKRSLVRTTTVGIGEATAAPGSARRAQGREACDVNSVAGEEHAAAEANPSRRYLAWPQVQPFWEIGSFLPQQFGLLFNLRLTVNHRTLGISDHRDGARLVSDLTHDLGARLEYWEPGSSYHWVYRHEGDRTGGLVSRILLSIPDHLSEDAIGWLYRFAARRTPTSLARNPSSKESSGQEAHVRPPAAPERREDDDSHAIQTDVADERLLDRGDGDAMSATRLRPLLIAYRLQNNRDARVRFHWQGIRALSRCLDPDLSERDEKGEKRALADLLGIPKRWRAAVGDVATVQGMGASKHLTHRARKIVANGDMGILSALRERAWSHLDNGWEVTEHRARRAERERRDNALALVSLRFAGDDELSTARRKEELQALESSFDPNPKSWRRAWNGWWQTPVSKTKGRSRKA